MQSLRLLPVIALVSPAALLNGCATAPAPVASPVTPSATPTSTATVHPSHAAPRKTAYCSAELLSAPQFQPQKKQELIYEGGFRYENIPAKIAWGEKRIQIEPARHVREITPAQYRDVTEEVEVLRERYELRTTPAVYKTETKRVKTHDSYLRWQPGCRGEAQQCAVVVPAQYTYVKRSLLAVPAITKRVFLPSETVSIRRKVLVRPGTGTGGVIPAKYRTIKVGRVVSPWQVKTTQEANRYQPIAYQKRIHPQKVLNRPVPCETQFSTSDVQRIQAALQTDGLSLTLTGKLDAQTHKALLAYQEKHQLPSGTLTFTTLKKLGVR